MKAFKLKIHPENFSAESLIFNSADFPDVKLNDLLKIYHINSSSISFLLVQVKSIKGELQKDTISINQNLATKFNLQIFQDVHVVKVEPEDVTIDLLEVSFKDQYISRSDMLRMKRHLVNSCVYIDEKVQFSDIRAQVSEMWANSEKVKCGFISDHTNFVLRSFTAKVYLFIQMSSEMWEYDAYGYLQFERAVNGFLKALFTKWKDKKCCHELTLVLFSRTFYDTTNIEDFPADVREIIRKNYKGQYYLDFYKCVAQTERMDDCTPLIKVLKKLFHKYQSITTIPGCPPGKNSTSSEGNFLEAINMSLNVFEHHYINRHLDRTGQIVVCITPGVGVFDVDRDLTILTKERMIDNGIGSDLICLGQQPLHAVPLFKFHHAKAESRPTGKGSVLRPPQQSQVQDFNIPHWINHSFYTINPFSDQGTTNINYIPRIHVAKKITKKSENVLSGSFVANANLSKNEVEPQLPTLQQMNYADFDKEVFGFQRLSNNWKQISSDSTLSQKNSFEFIKKRPIKSSDDFNFYSPDNTQTSNLQSRPMYIPTTPRNQHFAHLTQSQGLASSVGATNNLEKYYQNQKNQAVEVQPVVGSANLTHDVWKEGAAHHTQRRALFNPFNPRHMFAPLTANRRRWVHTYPRGPQGEALVLHHQNPLTRSISRSRRTSEKSDEEMCNGSSLSEGLSPPASYDSTNTSVSFQRYMTIRQDYNDSASGGSDGSSPSAGKNMKFLPGNESISWSLNPNPAENYTKDSRQSSSKLPISSFGLSWMWGIAGDIQWTPDTKTGLDWKSLKCPACLPITTDYYPSSSHLLNTYSEHSYFLVPDEAESERGDSDEELKTPECGLEMRGSREVFQELINQRLCHGFQIIKHSTRDRNQDSVSSGATVISPNTSDAMLMAQMCGGGTSPMCSSPRGWDNTFLSRDSYMLSHGRQYHIVRFASDEDRIEVKIYKPRHAFVTVVMSYGYMLWPTTRGLFQPTRCSFGHDKVEDYYWNHHDYYVCYPEGDLQTKMKFWRAKFVVLSNPHKRLQRLERNEEDGKVRYCSFDGCGCDKSHDSSMEGGECGVMTEGFIRFLEAINKIKRAHSQSARKSWKSFASFSPSLSKSYTSLSTMGGSGACASNHATPTPPLRPTSGTPTSDRSTPVRPTDTFSGPSTMSTKLSHAVDTKPVPMRTPGEGGGDFDHERRPSTHLTSNSELVEIINGMKDPECGLCFLPTNIGFHKHTFVSLEAVHWALANVSGLETIDDACKLFETLCRYSMIVPSSGNFKQAFVYGYVFYRISEEQNNEIEDPTSYQYTSVCETCHDRWFEVAVRCQGVNSDPAPTEVPIFGSNNPSEGKSGAFYITPTRDSPRNGPKFPDKHTVRIPLMNKARTNRTEWCQARYTTRVRTGVDSLVFAFEMQWMVATASCISNMLQLWCRKAASSDLYLLPVPSDPFALPRDGVGGPLRSPLFVPLRVMELITACPGFKDFGKNVTEYRDMMFAFMEAILCRFGFIRDDTDSQHLDSKMKKSLSPHYIHCTGQVFAQIPLQGGVMQRHSFSLKQRPATPRSGSGSGLNRFVGQSELDSTGFYWSVNYMQTKRWRIGCLDDYPAQDIEQDFVKFCFNGEKRLEEFFNVFISTYGSQ